MLYRVDYLDFEGRYRIVVADDEDAAMRIAASQLAEREDAAGNPGFAKVQTAIDDRFFLILPATEEDLEGGKEAGVEPLTAEEVKEILPFDLTGLRRGQDRDKAMGDQFVFSMFGYHADELEDEQDLLADLSEAPA